KGAGLGSGIRDDEYKNVGAELTGVEDVWRRAELILKVKEPVPEEYPRLRAGQVLFTYLHLAPAPELTRALRAAGTVAIAYETVQRADGSLPLLTPMSEVAGRLAVQEGAFYLGRAHGGRGILLSGVPGVPPGNVVVIGAGIVGVNAARIAIGLGADVSILDVNPDRLRADERHAAVCARAGHAGRGRGRPRQCRAGKGHQCGARPRRAPRRRRLARRASGAARQRSRLGNDQPSLSSFVVRRAVPTARI